MVSQWGWFHSALLTAVGTRNRAPYNAVLTHGFVVDADGRKQSKSLGNVIAPSEVIQKYGAEILRLWVSATDYREDIRISDRIRNTSRFMLGNLFDFDPQTDEIPYESMPEIDRFALHKLQGLVQKTHSAYDAYEYHTIYHSLHNYCTLDLSSFYLDILKDRLYTSPPKSAARKSAQTVLHTILDTLVKLIEIWEYMPQQSQRAASVHLTLLPEVNDGYKNPEIAQKWEQLLVVRGEVTKALEESRANKLIGHPLDASVTLSANEELYHVLQPYAADLRSIFIVSQVELVKAEKLENAFTSEEVEGLAIQIGTAPGEKCERCWVYDITVGTHADHPSICNRCSEALAKMV
jgi:isoleucyl-tRNA synthetase